MKKLEELAMETKAKKKQSDAPRLRIYNLAGNPMMLALIDGKIDVIFETEGQRCHDVVAGFIIALAAGASLKNLDTGENLTEEDIVTVLNNPSAKFRYVMACNEQLANDVVQLLNSKNGAVVEFKDPSLVTAEDPGPLRDPEISPLDDGDVLRNLLQGPGIARCGSVWLAPRCW